MTVNYSLPPGHVLAAVAVYPWSKLLNVFLHMVSERHCTLLVQHTLGIWYHGYIVAVHPWMTLVSVREILFDSRIAYTRIHTLTLFISLCYN